MAIEDLKILFITDIHQNISALKKINFKDYDLFLCGGDILDQTNPDINLAKEIIDILPEKTFIVPGNCDKGNEINDLIDNRLINIHLKKVNFSDIPIAGIGYSRSLKEDLIFYRKYFNNEKKIFDFYNSSNLKFILDFCGIKVNGKKIVINDEEETIQLRSAYFNKFESFKENEIDTFFYNIDSLSNGIILTHSPPFETLDKLDGLPNVGSISIKNGVIKTKPKLVLCGHFHELEGTVKFEGTTIFNPGALKENKFGVISIKNDIIKTKVQFV